MLEQCEVNVIEQLERLQNSENRDIWKRASAIIDRYWGDDAPVDEERDDEQERNERGRVEEDLPPWRMH